MKRKRIGAYTLGMIACSVLFASCGGYDKGDIQTIGPIETASIAYEVYQRPNPAGKTEVEQQAYYRAALCESLQAVIQSLRGIHSCDVKINSDMSAITVYIVTDEGHELIKTEEDAIVDIIKKAIPAPEGADVAVELTHSEGK